MVCVCLCMQIKSMQPADCCIIFRLRPTYPQVLISLHGWGDIQRAILPSSFFASPPAPLRSWPPKSSYGSGEHCKPPSGVWGRDLAEIEFGAF